MSLLESGFSKAPSEENHNEIQAKTIRLQKKLAEIERWRDGGGTPMDAGIKNMVGILNVLDMATLASCEGHIDGGLCFPWVDIASGPEPAERFVDEEKIFREVAAKYRVTYEEVRRGIIREAWLEANRLAFRNGETSEFKRWTTENRELAKKLQRLLDEFYQERNVKPQNRLVLSVGAETAIRLHNDAGADYRLNTTGLGQDQQARLLPRLKEYQSEMDAFTEFLLDKYMTPPQHSHGYPSSCRDALADGPERT